MANDEPRFEVEVATAEEFLRLLKEREDEAFPQGPRGAIGRAVFVARMLDQRASNYGFPMVRRYVMCGFAYGRNVVCYRRTTSNAVELPKVNRKTEERQQEAYEEIRVEIERGLKDMGLDLPVHEGFLRHPRTSAKRESRGEH